MKLVEKLKKITKKQILEYEHKILSCYEGKIDIDKEVDNLFDTISWRSRVLFWYWHFRETLRKLEDMEKINKKWPLKIKEK